MRCNVDRMCSDQDRRVWVRNKVPRNRIAPASELVLAGHAEQLPIPIADLYVPDSHAEHSSPPPSPPPLVLSGHAASLTPY